MSIDGQQTLVIDRLRPKVAASSDASRDISMGAPRAPSLAHRGGGFVVQRRKPARHRRPAASAIAKSEGGHSSRQT